jgi:hypothetical protein
MRPRCIMRPRFAAPVRAGGPVPARAGRRGRPRRPAVCRPPAPPGGRRRRGAVRRGACITRHAPRPRRRLSRYACPGVPNATRPSRTRPTVALCTQPSASPIPRRRKPSILAARQLGTPGPRRRSPGLRRPDTISGTRRAKCCGCTEAFQASRAGSIPVARSLPSRPAPARAPAGPT